MIMQATTLCIERVLDFCKAKSITFLLVGDMNRPRVGEGGEDGVGRSGIFTKQMASLGLKDCLGRRGPTYDPNGMFDSGGVLDYCFSWGPHDQVATQAELARRVNGSDHKAILMEAKATPAAADSAAANICSSVTEKFETWWRAGVEEAPPPAERTITAPPDIVAFIFLKKASPLLLGAPLELFPDPDGTWRQALRCTLALRLGALSSPADSIAEVSVGVTLRSHKGQPAGDPELLDLLGLLDTTSCKPLLAEVVSALPFASCPDLGSLPAAGAERDTVVSWLKGIR